MFKRMSFFTNDNLDSFLDSLTYWQEINLYTVLTMGSSHKSYSEAKKEAILEATEDDNLKDLLDRSLNSPDAQ